jgi:hypothetical protein
MRPSRRDLLYGTAAVTLSGAYSYGQQRRLFDSHCHIIDHRFPIVANRRFFAPRDRAVFERYRKPTFLRERLTRFSRLLT